jgi:hypothetical protein
MKKSSVSFVFIFLGIFFLISDHSQGFPSLPDLTVTFVNPGTLKEPKVTVGEDISSRIQLRVDNRGQAEAKRFGVAIVFSSSPSIAFSPIVHAPILSGRAIWQKEVETSLAPGGSQVISVSPFRIPDDISWGDYYLTAIVDPGKKVAESSENNNQAQAGIFVQARLNYIDQTCQLYDGPVYLNVQGKGFGYWKSTMVARVGPYTIPTQAGNWENNHVRAYPSPGLIPVGNQVYDWCLYDGSRPICRVQKAIWQAWLTRAIPPIGSQGTMVKINCCTCCPTQGTKKLYLWKGDQNKYEVPVTSWSDKLITCTIPHIPIPPGQYIFAVYDQGQRITLTVSGDVAYFTIE